MNKLLVNRLNKRVTILRPPRRGEWEASAGNQPSFSLPGSKTIPADAPAYEYWDAWVKPTSYNLDDYGEATELLVPVATVWAAIEPLRGREFFAAKAEQAEVTTRIRIRYREGIDRTMVVRYGKQEFEVLYVIHPEFDRKELQLMCKERQ